ncbi:MAG: Hint domain-containing protein, partial [Parasphingorhabdus sp.]|uniref:Hint domain-containing protein n=1 Tax=Parasphingorhabdus sp. TaxID=2709688 RepID=UPI00329833C3
MADIYSFNGNTGSVFVRALPNEDLSGWSLIVYDQSGNGSAPVDGAAIDTSIPYGTDPSDGYVYYLQVLDPFNSPSGQRDALVLVDENGDATDAVGWGKDEEFDLIGGPGDGIEIDPDNGNYAPGDGPWYTDGPPWETSPTPISPPGDLIPLPPPCFASGTSIATPDGQIRIEDIQTGQMVNTRDGPKRVLWIGRAKVIFDGEATEHLRPIVFRAGCFGFSRPSKDLLLSPQHRVLCRSSRCELMFGIGEVLVPAKSLQNGKSISIEKDLHCIEYYHLLLEDHFAVKSNGIWAESLLA